MLKENLESSNIQPFSSTSSSYSSSSSFTSSSSKYNMDQKQSTNKYSNRFCNCSYNENMQQNLSLVMNDLKQVCCTLSLLARQIDQVVNKIDSKFGTLMNECNNENFEIETQNSLRSIKNFTKILNSNIPNFTEQKHINLSKHNSSNRNENIINNYIADTDIKKSLSERKSNNYDTNDFNSKINLWNPKNDSIQRTKCTRSKSQPAFKDANLITTSASTNTNLNRFSIYDTSRMTSSPISNTDKNLQLTENSNGDSSFYEDQLDNELEGIRENTSESSLGVVVVKESTVKKESSPPNGIQKRPKSSSSNYHVSFNINNAIYTSKQETPIPIPISILKQANQNKLNNEVVNSSNSSSSSTSPLQSSMKKSPAINFSKEITENENKKGASTKQVRIDTKTTIL